MGLKVGLSKGSSPPENLTDPTQTDRFWAGLKIFGLGFGPKSQVIFGFGSVLGPINVLLQPKFFCWRKTLPFVVLSSAESRRSEYPSESSWVEDQESSEGKGNVVALIGVLDFQAVEAGQGSIGSEITVAFPDLYVSEGAILLMKRITELSKWKEISM